MLSTGDVLAGKYRVERVLGKGGMGYVVAAMHTQLDERVAVKVLMPELCVQEEPVARFLREARAAVRIRSEHVARVLDVGVLDDGGPYMVMEYLEGHDLAAELDRRMQLDVQEAVEYLLQACEAIAEAHARGIVHRDLKPANLFLTRRADGSPLVKVLDFGISKAVVADGAPAASLTATQSLLGSPNYMSPEQVRKPKTVDVRTDIWSLGVILYELLTGSVPFAAENAMSVLAAVVSDPTPRVRDTRPDIPERLDAVISICLSKEPGQRFSTVAEFAEALLPFAPPSAIPSVKRIAGVLRSSGEGSTPPTPARDSNARTRTPPPEARSSEHETLVSSDSDRPPAQRHVSTDPTLRAEWAPPSGGRVVRSSETASQWEHSKAPLDRKRRKMPLIVVGLGLLASLVIAGVTLSTLRTPPEVAPGTDARAGASEELPSLPASITVSPVASAQGREPPESNSVGVDAAAPLHTAKVPDAKQAVTPSKPVARGELRRGSSRPEPRAPASAAPPHVVKPETPREETHPTSVDPLEGRR